MINSFSTKAKQLENPSFDPVEWLDKAQVEAVLELTTRHGGAKEGDIFSCDGSLERRRLFSFICLHVSSMLEIGFNRGLSALLALSVNPGIRIVNIDICIHPYVEPIHSFIRDLYPGQLDLIAGDSRIVFPSNSPEKFDLYVVDGGHGIECCNADISSCLSHAKHGALLYIDDLDYTEVASVVDRFILQGKIREISFRSQFLKTIYSSVFAI